MACFLIPAGEAVIATAVKKAVEKKEESANLIEKEENTKTSVPFSRKLRWLTSLLWGGSVLLLFEHIWHGEIVPWFPFLSAMATKEDTAEMLHEMATVGVAMAILITCVWAGMLVVSSYLERKAALAEETETQEV